ncbi:hypothetical protein RUND412_000509 [Rhizina undulata]
MHDHTSHRLLQQLPLTVSPFIHLPVAITLPYSYTTLPTSLPLSSTTPQTGAGYITSPSGSISTTPDAIISSCQALIQHLRAQQSAAEDTIKEWEKSIDSWELMEKRRVAPGYLDTGLRILEPTRKSPPAEAKEGTGKTEEGTKRDGAGEELDRMFGKMGV